MTNHVIKHFALFICLCGQSYSIENEKKTITWMMLDYEPYYIKGNPKNPGVHNYIAKYFSEELKNYNHSFIDVNASRLFRLLTSKSETIYCSPGLGGKPFKKEVIYSKSMFQAPAAGFAVLKNSPFAKDHSISLMETLANSKIKIGWPEKGTFGPKIQKVFEKYQERIVIINNVQVAIGTSMVLKKRIDGFLTYPLAFHYSQRNNSEANKLKFVRIKDEPLFTPTHSLCSNTKEGKKAIIEINKVLETQEYKKRMKAALIKHIPVFLKKDFLRKNP